MHVQFYLLISWNTTCFRIFVSRFGKMTHETERTANIIHEAKATHQFVAQCY